MIHYLKFIFIGGINASIYFLLLIFFINLFNSNYLAIAISQIIIAVIAYVNFSLFSFKKKLNVNIFYKFIISNIFLFLCSIFISWATRLLNLSSIMFGLVNVSIISPLSYAINSKFVFKFKKNEKT